VGGFGGFGGWFGLFGGGWGVLGVVFWVGTGGQLVRTWGEKNLGRETDVEGGAKLGGMVLLSELEVGGLQVGG